MTHSKNLYLKGTLPPPVPIRWILVRDPQGVFEPRTLLCSDQQADAVQIISWFVLRWAVDMPFHEVRAHLGVETQRHRSDLVILRTTPALLGCFSLGAIGCSPMSCWSRVSCSSGCLGQQNVAHFF